MCLYVIHPVTEWGHLIFGSGAGSCDRISSVNKIYPVFFFWENSDLDIFDKRIFAKVNSYM